MDGTNIALAASLVSIVISIISVFFVWRQTRIQENITRSQLSTDLIMTLHSDADRQKVLDLVYDDRLEFRHVNPGTFVLIMKGHDANIAADVEKLLNLFQIVGNLFFTKALKKRDIRGLRYASLSLGRNDAIYSDLAYLSSDYQTTSDIRHDHFLYFKQLYLFFEYDRQYADKIGKCLIVE